MPQDGTRAEVIAKFRRGLEIMGEPFAEKIRRELRGKDLVCWCAPEPCHADVLLEVANASPDVWARVPQEHAVMLEAMKSKGDQ